MPASRNFEFSDPYPYQTAVRAANVEVFLASRGEFRGNLIQIDLIRLWLQRGSESLPGISHCAAPPGRAALEFLTGRDLTVPTVGKLSGWSNVACNKGTRRSEIAWRKRHGSPAVRRGHDVSLVAIGAKVGQNSLHRLVGQIRV
jgi:hypothetical protein